MNFLKFIGIFIATFIGGCIFVANSRGFQIELAILYTVSLIASLISIFYINIIKKMDKIISIIDKQQKNNND